MIGRVCTQRPRLVPRPYHANESFGTQPSPVDATAENFLRREAPDGRSRRDDATDTDRDRQTVPWLANAKAVDLPLAHRVDQERRWNHHESNVMIRIDAAGGEPVTQLVVVAGEWI